MFRRAIPLLVIVVALTFISLAAPPEGGIPTPSQFLKINVGSDGVLADYDQIVEYWKAVDASGCSSTRCFIRRWNSDE